MYLKFHNFLYINNLYTVYTYIYINLCSIYIIHIHIQYIQYIYHTELYKIYTCTDLLSGENTTHKLLYVRKERIFKSFLMGNHFKMKLTHEYLHRNMSAKI